MISIVCVYNNEEQYTNMVNSVGQGEYEFIPINNCEGHFSSAAQALNFGAKKSTGDILIFCHQDVLFGEESISMLIEPIINDLKRPIITGSCGAGLIENVGGGGYYCVSSLDECCIAMSKYMWEKFKFNEILCDGWHLYAVELCIRMRNSGGYCLTHENIQVEHFSIGNVNEAYMKTYRKLQKVYKNENPMITTCKTLKNNPISFYGYYFIWKIKRMLLKNYPLVYRLKSTLKNGN